MPRWTDGEQPERAEASPGCMPGPGYRRGIAVGGGEFAAPAIDDTSDFSNESPGVYNRSYHYDTRATFDFLASRGIDVVRVPFR